MTDTIKFLKVRDVKSPSRANKYDAGIDFYVPEFTTEFVDILRQKNPGIVIYFNLNPESAEDNCITLEPGDRVLIPSGIHCQMSSPGRALIAANKSGVATKSGLIFGAQVVDYEYQGEIHLSVINASKGFVNIFPGMKILQFIETPIFNSEIVIDSTSTFKQFYNSETTRGVGGFGSSDKNDGNVHTQLPRLI